MDIKDLQECLLAEEIKRIELLSRDALTQELIDATAEKLESLSLNGLIEYQQNKHK